MSLNMEQPFTTGAVEEQILFGDPATSFLEESKQQTSLLETPPSVNPSLSPALNYVWRIYFVWTQILLWLQGY